LFCIQFTAQSWLVQLFLTCPPQYEAEGVICPNVSAVAQFKEAVASGFITWHAFPFNGEAELADVNLFQFGLEMTHALDDLLGVPRKTVMSQRDGKTKVQFFFFFLLFDV
jgi:hypothetical protein